jgi:DNA-binding NarL/FixJ family response regulator
MDISMSVMGGIEATRRILTEFPTIPVVMLTMALDETSIFDAFKAGARGYILKDIRARELKRLLGGVLHGESVLSGAVAKIVVSEFKRHKPSISNGRHDEGRWDPLTEREVNILQLVVDGCSNNEIADHLFLSEQTIKKSLGEIMKKLHVDNRVRAATYAVRNGLAK